MFKVAVPWGLSFLAASSEGTKAGCCPVTVVRAWSPCPLSRTQVQPVRGGSGVVGRSAIAWQSSAGRASPEATVGVT